MNQYVAMKIKRLQDGETILTSEPGNSMLPLYKSNEKHILTPISWEKCSPGDVVFSKVKGMCVTHKVYAVDPQKGVQVGNNKGHINGWTKNVYGLAHKIPSGVKPEDELKKYLEAKPEISNNDGKEDI